MNIEASKEACEQCEGDVRLVFKESIQKSPAESTVDERIRAKIKDLTKVNTITVDASGYSVQASASEIVKNPAISSMRPTISVDGN